MEKSDIDIIRVMVDRGDGTEIVYWRCSFEDAKTTIWGCLSDAFSYIRFEDVRDATCLFLHKNKIDSITITKITEGRWTQ